MLGYFISIKFLLLMMMYIILVSTYEEDPSSNQLLCFKNKTQGPIGILTTESGAPVDEKDAGSTLNTNLLRNAYVIESLAHLARERIPVRVVHTKGAGAFGYFITTHDISDKCKASFLSEVGKKTPISVRFSMRGTDKGGSDLTREPRGFAVKIYTEEGNFDIVGLNTPMFFLKDPVYFASFEHAAGKNPATDFTDANMLWDFLTQRTEALFFFLRIFSDQGIHDGYRHMPGYSIHTYVLYNAAGTRTYARFHFEPLSGIKTLNSTEAAKLGAKDPDYSARDLYDAIACGEFPAWEVSLQLMSEKDVQNVTFDPFDLTKIIPESQFPLCPIGKIVLNKNPKNYFAEVEQMAFCPSNLIPGVLPSPDKVFEARGFSYKDANRYRLGTNFENIQVNCPYKTKFTFNRDGTPPLKGNLYDAPNYYPNSFNGPVPYTDKSCPSLPCIYEAEANNFEQATEYYNEFTCEERNRLVENIVDSLCNVYNFIQDRAIKAFRKISSDLADRIDKKLKENNCKSNLNSCLSCLS